MPDTKTDGLAVMTAAGLAPTDLFMVIDVSDNTMDPTGTNKRITAADVYAVPSVKPTSGYLTTSSKYQSSLNVVLNSVMFVPMTLAVGHAYTNFGVMVDAAGAAGSVVRIGLYAPGNGVPGALITDGGTVSTTTTGRKYVAINYTPTSPIVWVAAVGQVTTTSLQLGGPNNNAAWNQTALYESGTQLAGALGQSGVSGALPSTPGTLFYDNWSFNFTAIAY